MNKLTKAALSIAAVAGVAVGGAALASAAIPAKADGSITACYSTANPTLRVIDAEKAGTCAAGETKVSWGGGMRFKGELNPGVGMTVGDVVRVTRDTGCGTPKGTWVATAGLDYYLCPSLAHPEYWAPLSLDPTVTTHWYTLNADGSVAATSDATRPTVYNYSGYTYVLPSGVDLTKCAVTATSNDYSKRTTVAAQLYSGYILVTEQDANRSFVATPVSLTLNCGTAT